MITMTMKKAEAGSAVPANPDDALVQCLVQSFTRALADNEATGFSIAHGGTPSAANIPLLAEYLADSATQDIMRIADVDAYMDPSTLEEEECHPLYRMPEDLSNTLDNELRTMSAERIIWKNNLCAVVERLANAVLKRDVLIFTNPANA